MEKIKKIALIVLGLILIINIIFLTSITQEFNKKIKEAKESARPADISLTIINADCKDCKDINGLIDMIKNADFNYIDAELREFLGIKFVFDEGNYGSVSDKFTDIDVSLAYSPDWKNWIDASYKIAFKTWENKWEVDLDDIVDPIGIDDVCVLYLP